MLLVGDLFHPVDNLAFKCLRDGDVGHGCGRDSAVPVLLAGLEPDNVSPRQGAVLPLRPAAVTCMKALVDSNEQRDLTGCVNVSCLAPSMRAELLNGTDGRRRRGLFN
jgi:hypothetical protein